MIESIFDFKQQQIFHKGVATYYLSLYPPKHHHNRVCNNQLDKVALDPMGVSPTEKIKCIECSSPNITLFVQDNQAQELKIRINMDQKSLNIIWFLTPIILEPKDQKSL